MFCVVIDGLVHILPNGAARVCWWIRKDKRLNVHDEATVKSKRLFVGKISIMIDR